jgi:hypothetical protein
MRRGRVGAALAVVYTVLLLGAPAAQAAAIVQQDVVRAPVSFDEINPCTNELVHFEGSYTSVQRFITDADGGVHWSFSRYHVDAVGTSESGATYRYMTGGGDFTNGEPWFETPERADSFSTSLRAVVVSQGSAENWVMDVVFHTTLSPSGQTTQFANTHSSCVG